MATHKSSYRADIQGLRALAVAAVLIFHFSHNKLPGGFTRVDVFFVISGFLMTSIIFRGLENQSFSLLKFYQARALRIVPNLLFTVAALLILGYLFFAPLTYQLRGKHAASSLTFISNIIYKKESGYFDVDAYNKFLLHTWSLSVEWQFYMIYPIILLCLKRFFSIKTLKYIVLSLTFILFAYCVFVTYKRPTSAYYAFYARAWEMMVGGVAFLFPLSVLIKHKFKIELSGIALICLSFFYISDRTPWPGYWALIPVLGTYACIITNNRQSILSGYIIQKIGLWSYSIYLVHWPVLVFVKQMSYELSFQYYVVGVVLFSFILYELVEKRRDYKYGLLALFIIILSTSLYISTDGISSRVDKKYQLTAREFQARYKGCQGLKETGDIQFINSNRADFDFILTGDSLSQQYFSFLKRHHYKYVDVSKNGCISAINFMISAKVLGEKDKALCELRTDRLINFANQYEEKPIILGQNWADYLYHMSKDQFIKEIDLLLSSMGKDRNYFIIGMLNQEQYSAYQRMSEYTLPIYKFIRHNNIETQPNKLIKVNQFLREYAAHKNNVFYLDPNEALCKEGWCKLYTAEKEPIYADPKHLSIYGTEIVGKYIFDFVRLVEHPKRDK